ncbi:carbohydrate-binding module family 50 protein [Sodiomyces alcalophilus JCM 7366]|uniref:carbohydrate-binding module family 50 protein n=1 Tax=Sodiomyces alcalophilus JCM 7366 TaxID=591952 RepID=UPI0039B4F394
MSRFSHYDTDEERLPEGMTRIGYDADTQTYTYRDADGSHWEGAPGAQYGRLTRVSNGSNTTGPGLQGTEESEPFIPGLEPWEVEKKAWRQAWAPLFNFFMLVGLFLIGVVWLLYRSRGTVPAEADCAPGQAEYTIAKGDTCWDIAQEKSLSLEELLAANEGLNCDKLRVGRVICVPRSGTDDQPKKEGS